MLNFFGDKMPVLPWMINYKCPNEVNCYKTKNATEPTNSLDFRANLDLNPKVGRRALTKFACTVGPDTTSYELIELVLEEGITTICIDASRNNEEQLQTFIRNIRKTILSFSSYCGRVYPVCILIELGAVHMKTGFLRNNAKGEILLVEDEHICLTPNEDYKCDCTKKIIYINFKEILEILKPEDLVYIDYGKIIFEVIHINLKYRTIKCRIQVGGMLRNEALVYIPNIPPQYEIIDTEGINFGLKNEMDGVIVPRVQSAHDVNRIREILMDSDPSVMIFSNIETVTAVQNIDEIIEASEGIIMSRNILNMMFPTEKMNIIQKILIAKCNKAGVPIFCHVSKFSCNTNKFVLNYEESIDMSNLILDGIDGFLLSEEVLNSANVATSLQLLHRSCLESESAIFQKQVLSNYISHLNTTADLFHSFAISAVDLCVKSNATCIIVLTVSGRAARVIAQYKVPCPLLAVTKYGHTARKLNMWRSVSPIHFIAHTYDNWEKETNMRFEHALTYGKYFGLIQGGDPIVLINSGKEGQGFSNTMKVIYASANNCALKSSLLKKRKPLN